MASKHEEIKHKLFAEWTKESRGRLYSSSQGLAYPVIQGPDGIKPSDYPIWFGPLNRKFKGFPDSFGFENDLFFDTSEKRLIRVPVFCTVEVKTKGDKVKKDQKETMNWLISQGARCYVAWEDDSKNCGFHLEKWERKN